VDGRPGHHGLTATLSVARGPSTGSASVTPPRQAVPARSAPDTHGNCARVTRTRVRVSGRVGVTTGSAPGRCAGGRVAGGGSDTVRLNGRGTFILFPAGVVIFRRLAALPQPAETVRVQELCVFLVLYLCLFVTFLKYYDVHGLIDLLIFDT